MDWLEVKMDLNLAAWKYRELVNGEKNSPIKKLSRNCFLSSCGKTEYEVYAFLKDELTAEKMNHDVYGSVDGTGTDTSLVVATHKAISESLERWAFYECINGNMLIKYGFDREKSSSGMAAYPGLFKKSTRERAFLEAVERWALRNWWEGFLPHQIIDHESHSVMHILTPWSDVKVVVLFGWSGEFYYYGFSAGRSVTVAYSKALTEFDRNARVLTRFYRTNPAKILRRPVLELAQNIYEKRLIFFSTANGNELFLRRVSRNVGKLAMDKIPECVVDREIIGAWTKYACVWRVLFSGSSNGHLYDDPEYFFF